MLTHFPTCQPIPRGYPKSCVGSLFSWKPPVMGLQDHQFPLTPLVHITSQATPPSQLQLPTTALLTHTTDSTPDSSHVALHTACRDRLAIQPGSYPAPNLQWPQLPKESPHSCLKASQSGPFLQTQAPRTTCIFQVPSAFFQFSAAHWISFLQLL